MNALSNPHVGATASLATEALFDAKFHGCARSVSSRTSEYRSFSSFAVFDVPSKESMRRSPNRVSAAFAIEVSETAN